MSTASRSGVAVGVGAPPGARKRPRLVLELPFGVSRTGPSPGPVEKKARVREETNPTLRKESEQKSSRQTPVISARTERRQVQLPVPFRDVEGRVGVLLSSFPHVSFSIYQKGSTDSEDVDVFTNLDRSLQGARWIDEHGRVSEISVTDINLLDVQNMRPATELASGMLRAQKLEQWCIGRYNDQIPRTGQRVLDENVEVVITSADNDAYQKQTQPVLDHLPRLRVLLRAL